MLLGFVLLFLYGFIVWVVFFKFRWLKFTIAWGFFSTFFVLHLGIIFLLGLRYVAPASTEARVIQHTIQLVPRLPEPTLVTEVLVQQNVPVKKGQPLFQFDRRPYEYKVRQLEAQLAKAKQDVLILKADTAINNQKIAKIAADLEYSKYQLKLSTELAKEGAGPEEDAQKWGAQVAAHQAGIKEAQAEETRARLRYTSDINGVNTTVAAIEAELEQARYYLDNTRMVAPEDGYVMNLNRSALDLWVGAFVAIGIGAILFLALKVGNLINFASAPGYRLEADFDNIGGLKLRAPVKAAAD